MAKGYSKPVVSDTEPINISQEILDAQLETEGKLKLTFILRSNSAQGPQLGVDELIEVYVETGMDEL